MEALCDFFCSLSALSAILRKTRTNVIFKQLKLKRKKKNKIIMDAIVKLVEMNSRNPWSRITSEKMFLSFLQGANVHNCAGFFVKSSEDKYEVTKTPPPMPTVP